MCGTGRAVDWSSIEIAPASIWTYGPKRAPFTPAGSVCVGTVPRSGGITPASRGSFRTTVATLRPIVGANAYECNIRTVSDGVIRGTVGEAATTGRTMHWCRCFHISPS